METDCAVLAARIRAAHPFPSLVTSEAEEFTSTVVADSLATENVTLTATISTRRFDVGPGRWDPAAAGTVVTVTVASTDTSSGARRHVASHEPEAWVRAVFAEFDDAVLRIYLLGDVDPDTGQPERGLIAYRGYFDETAMPIRVPPQLVRTLHHWIGPLN